MELDKVSAVLAHELRNPLAGIVSQLDCLREMFDPDDPRLGNLDWIDREVDRMSRTISAVLDFARGADPRVTDLAAGTWFAQVAARAEGQARRREVTFTCRQASDAWLLQADPDLLERVVENLVDNALKVVAPGEGKVHLAAERRGDHLRISCTDNGPGIPAKFRERIFEPFFTRSAKGAGLGLYLARRIAEDHGGTLEVSTRIGEGSTFFLELPLAVRKEQESHVALGR